jgi:hypothetical protein
MELVARLRLILPHSHYDKQVVGQAADFIERIARSENLKRVITNG